MFKQFIANVLLFLVINLFPARGDKYFKALEDCAKAFRKKPAWYTQYGICYFLIVKHSLERWETFILLGKKYGTRDYTFGHNNSQGYTWVTYENHKYDRSNYCAARLETLKRLKLIKK